MWRHLSSNFLTLMVVFVFLLGGVILWGKQKYTAPGPLAEQVCLQVPAGSTMRKIADRIADEGAISSVMIFRIGADYGNKNSQLKAGSWLIPEQASMHEITRIITEGGASTCGTEVLYRIGVTSAEVEVREMNAASGRYEEQAAFDPLVDETLPETYDAVKKQADTRYRIAIAEGATNWQIVETLKAIDILEGEIENVPDEGWLAPHSYEVQIGDSRQGIIDKMQSFQEAALSEAWENRGDDLPVRTMEEALILASIIEKETGIPEERDVVASVFINRLNRGMQLQTDPTVIYGITEGEGVLGRGLRQSELRARTAYNTYVISGLPPTPIANPGKASIMAAVNPAETDYVYFVADGSGGHAFAKTLDEHNRNVAKWREIEAERQSQ